MNGPLKCGWGCGASFYQGEEREAHEKACSRRVATAKQRVAAAQQRRAGGGKATA